MPFHTVFPGKCRCLRTSAYPAHVPRDMPPYQLRRLYFPPGTPIAAVTAHNVPHTAAGLSGSSAAQGRGIESAHRPEALPETGKTTLRSHPGTRPYK